MDRRTFAARVLVLSAAAALIAPASAHAVDAQVLLVHVTQGVQPPNNSLPLVSHRRTAVRAVIGGDSSGAQPVGVTGKLDVFVDGRRITPDAGIRALNEPLNLSAQNFSRLTVEESTLNFELPGSVRARLQPASIVATNDVDFVVTLDGPADDPNKENNSGSASNLQMFSQIPATVFFVRVAHKPSGLDAPAFSFVRRGVGDAYLSANLPLDNICPSCLYRQGAPDIAFDTDLNGDGLITHTDPADDDDGDDLLAQLREMRALIAFDTFEDQFSEVFAPQPKFLFAWAPAGAFDSRHAGKSDTGAAVSYGTDNPAFGQMAMTHEVAHNFGLLDPEDQPGSRGFHWFNPTQRPLNPDLGWDVGAQVTGNPPANAYSGRLKPGTFVDILSVAATVGGSWINSLTARDLMFADRLWAPLNSGLPPTLPRRCNGRTFNLMGTLNAPTLDAPQLALRDFGIQWTYDWCTGAFLRGGAAAAGRTRGERDGRFVAVVRISGPRSNRTVRAPFDTARLANQHFVRAPAGGASAPTPGGFDVPIALRAGERVEAVRIEDRSASARFPVLRRSARAPVLRIAGPRRGATLRAPFTLRWSATDADTARSRLRYQVAYSPTNGNDFVPVAVRRRGTSLRIDPSSLPRTAPGRGLLRVFVSDGLNTRHASVTGLSAPSASWTLERPRDPRRRTR